MLRAVLMVACVLASLASGRAVWAHAMLLETYPPDGASLSVAPSEIVLRFNEPVVPVALRLLDARGADLATAAARAENNEVRLEVPTLPAGGYIASWRVVSADSHPIGGGFVFTVGGGPAPRIQPSAESSREKAWTFGVVLNRLVLYAGLFFAAGGTLFAGLVLRPLRIEVASYLPWRRYAAVLAMVAACLAVGLKGGQLGALPASALAGPAAWSLGFATSTSGSAAIIVAGLVVMVLAGRAGRAGAWLEMAGAATALAGFSATGHAATGAWWLQGLTALHVLCVGFWLGAFWPLLRLLPAHPAAAVAAARRFSNLAMPAVLLLVASGTCMALTRVQNLADFVSSAYGQLLLCKLLFVVPLLIVAAANRWQATPVLASGRRGASGRFARNIQVEIVLGFLLLLLTAYLAHTPPPGMAIHDHTLSTGRGYAIWATQRDRTLLLEVNPGVAGANAITARFATEAGDVLAPPEATVSFARPDAGIEAIVRPLARGADGVFRLERIDLPLAGGWHVRVDALIDDFDKASFETEIPISAASPTR